MLLYTLFFLYLCLLINGEQNPKVKISDGIVEGKILKTLEGREFQAYQGIPFAEPPVGKLRFSSPVPKKPWEGVLDATRPHTVCPQIDADKGTGEIDGKEDCLFLNVYKPTIHHENTDPLPVMVFFHGGGFHFGSGNSEYYGPETLLDRDIILVVTNYRLGLLGFLSTGDEVAPGNYGLKDQSLALKWINKNIRYFDGDPEKVTVFGNSAGATCSHLHMVSPLSKGLFHGVIAESGTLLNHWIVIPQYEAVTNVKKLAKELNCTINTSEEIVHCLRSFDPSTLISQEKIFMDWDGKPATSSFRPTIEPLSAHAFLPDTPENLLRTGNFQDVPVITGLNKDEGLIKTSVYLTKTELFEKLMKDFNKNIVQSLTLNHVHDPHSLSDKIKKFYLGEHKDITIKNGFSGITKIFTDIYFTKALDDAVKLHLNVSKKPMFIYLFAHESGGSFSQLSGTKELLGVSHADELMYLFPIGIRLFPHRKETESDKRITKLMTSMWANFAKTGNPTPYIDGIIKNKWEPVKSDKIEYYYIDSDVQEMRSEIRKEAMKFLRGLDLSPKNRRTKEEL
ncbi:hypothetical protein HHI36_005356 [Cryptolaemus montrouzieri]|uniref:Carboxylesterase type B domain-containing protein n=1 Tax=Cryptolaemus montrouzieri TaxID=559131 RepID=A0ABD2NUY7_9CUCU